MRVFKAAPTLCSISAFKTVGECCKSSSVIPCDSIIFTSLVATSISGSYLSINMLAFSREDMMEVLNETIRPQDLIDVVCEKMKSAQLTREWQFVIKTEERLDMVQPSRYFPVKAMKILQLFSILDNVVDAMLMSYTWTRKSFLKMTYKFQSQESEHADVYQHALKYLWAAGISSFSDSVGEIEVMRARLETAFSALKCPVDNNWRSVAVQVALEAFWFPWIFNELNQSLWQAIPRQYDWILKRNGEVIADEQIHGRAFLSLLCLSPQKDRRNLILYTKDLLDKLDEFSRSQLGLEGQMADIEQFNFETGDVDLVLREFTADCVARFPIMTDGLSARPLEGLNTYERD